MSIIDYIIFAIYMLAVLWVGFYFFKKNESSEDYYVGGRTISSFHIGLSVAATDVGGGFSIGLGGLGYAMGLSGSWLLFTGIVGAWMSAVLIIPKIKRLDMKEGLLTYPDFLRHKFDNRVAFTAALISGIGYLGFTGAQILAGAKLASATIFTNAPFGLSPFHFAIIVIAFVIIGYTALGGLKAVIFTDTIQWIVLFGGLLFFAIPFALDHIGGFAKLKQSLPPEFFTLTNVGWVTVVNWMITIIPIWFIAMTLYQRIYASRSVKEAKRAWYIAGVFEYPIMAFTGVFLGMISRVMFSGIEAEMGLPMLIRDVLPVGITGIVVSAYFSSIMSTADSCLMASSGNFVSDIIDQFSSKELKTKTMVRLSQIVTLLVGLLAVVIAVSFQTVLDAILYAYAFMVSGLLVPTIGAYFWKHSHSSGAFWGMVSGGAATISMKVFDITLPYGLDQIIAGILISAIVFVTVSLIKNKLERSNDE